MTSKHSRLLVVNLCVSRFHYNQKFQCRYILKILLYEMWTNISVNPKKDFISIESLRKKILQEDKTKRLQFRHYSSSSESDTWFKLSNISRTRTLCRWLRTTLKECGLRFPFFKKYSIALSSHFRTLWISSIRSHSDFSYFIYLTHLNFIYLTFHISNLHCSLIFKFCDCSSQGHA